MLHLKKNQYIHEQKLKYMVKTKVRQNIELNVVRFNHYQPLPPKSEKKKLKIFQKITKVSQFLKISNFFFQNILRLITQS